MTAIIDIGKLASLGDTISIHKYPHQRNADCTANSPSIHLLFRVAVVYVGVRLGQTSDLRPSELRHLIV